MGLPKAPSRHDQQERRSSSMSNKQWSQTYLMFFNAILMVNSKESRSAMVKQLHDINSSARLISKHHCELAVKSLKIPTSSILLTFHRTIHRSLILGIDTKGKTQVVIENESMNPVVWFLIEQILPIVLFGSCAWILDEDDDRWQVRWDDGMIPI